MEPYRKILIRLFFPQLWVTLLCIPVAVAGLFIVFSGNDSSGIPACAVYVFSAYTLTLVCIRVVRTAKHARKSVAAVKSRHPVVQRYLDDVSFHTHVSLYRSFGLNLLYVALKLSYGIHYRSLWFGALAGYYFLLAVMRFILLRYADKNRFGDDRIAEWKRYRLCGILLLMVNLALTVVVILMVRESKGFHYAGMLIYIMAIYAFYSLITAVIHVVKYRRYQSPVLSAAKILHLTTALVSLLALETAMLEQFGTDNSARFHKIMTGSTGGGVCALILILALSMLTHATREIHHQHKHKKEDSV